LITGAPLKNLGAAINLSLIRGQESLNLGRLVCQGGFAGEGVVPSKLQLDKFKGMVTCPSYNLNGDRESALAALKYAGINSRYFVSKNVCHRVYYDREMHKRLEAVKDKNKVISYIWRGMDAYLRKKPRGKKFHDPLAACCALDDAIGTWAEVELYYEKGQWGARLSPGSKTWIIIDYNYDKFIQVITAY